MESPLPPDPYAALGVPKNADAATIRSTYKRLALKYHPDKVVDEGKKAEATEKFHCIQEAYDVIGDEDKRIRYDAQVKLAQLQRQKLDLRGSGPRVEVRTAGYDIRTAAPAYASFSARGTARVYTEERRPAFPFDDDEPQRWSSRKFDPYAKRTTPKEKEKEEKRERVRVSDEERKRAERERRREAEVRESRSRKHGAYVVDEEYVRYDTERRQRDKEEEARRKEETPRRPPPRREEMYEDERKYEEAKRYMAAHLRAEEVRPGLSRGSSSRDTPYTYVRRTRRRSSPRAPPPRDPSPRESGPRRPENVGLYDSNDILHPPQRSHTTQTDFDSHRQAENDPPPVSLPRAHTMPTIPTSSTGKKIESKHSQPSRGRTYETAAQPESAYANASPPEGQRPYAQYPPPPPQAQPAKATTTTTTTTTTESGNKFDKYPAFSGYRIEVREPGSSSRRVPSPQREREAKPLSMAEKWAQLANGGSRAHASPTPRSSPFSSYPDATSSRPSMMQQSSSSRSIPRLSRSSERASGGERVRERERERERRYERERSRDRDRDRFWDDRRHEKFYGEKGPGYIRPSQANSGSFAEDVLYSRRARPEDFTYSKSGRRGSRDSVFYDDRRLPQQFRRSATMPVSATV